MKDNRVVITGLGMISPIGFGKTKFWNALINGESGISNISGFDISDFEFNQGGEISGFNPKDYITRKGIRYLDRITQFAISASHLALEDGEFKITPHNCIRVGVVIGTMYSGWNSIALFEQEMIKDQSKRVSPAFFPNTVINSSVSQVAIEFGIKCLCTSLSTSFCSGTDAIGIGYNYITEGKADVILAGGADELSKWVYGSHLIHSSGESSYFAYDQIMRPFDANRRGMILGEGAAILLMESYQHAVARGAGIYGEIIGYGVNNSACSLTEYDHSGVGAASAITLAMNNEKLSSSDIDYICTEGNGTIVGDKMEVSVLRRVLKKEYSHIPASSIKSMIGHTRGAAGAFNAVACCLAMENNCIPPTINYEDCDPDCDIDCVPNKARTSNVRIALSNSFSPGGNNSVLAFRKL